MSAIDAASPARAGEWRAGAGPIVVFAIGAAAIWLPPRPPMIDLPQTAGQIALLKGLISGHSPWAAELRIDAVTPYLITYLLATPLAFFMPVVTALKVLITGAFAGFGLVASAIRRELGAARELDAYAFIGFFGFAYAWGLVTFLVAAPLGLLLIWLSLRYAAQPSVRRAAEILAAGVALLFAHRLVFLFATGLGLVLAAARAGKARALPRRLWPFAALIAWGLGLYLLARSEPGDSAGFGFNFGDPLLRALGPLSTIDDRPDPWTIFALITLLALPFVGGLTIRVRRIEPVLIAGAVFGAVLLGPDCAWVASGIYRRFPLFLPPAYAWLFSDAGASASGIAGLLRPRLGLLVSAFAGLIMAQHVNEAAQFARETRDFDAVETLARPNQRALSVVIDEASAADVDMHVYNHFPNWYEADKGGLVDPEFASSPPSIVRYRRNFPPLYSDKLFTLRRNQLDWRRDDGDHWTYFFVRAYQIPSDLFAGAACPPALVGARGAWALYEKRTCGPANP